MGPWLLLVGSAIALPYVDVVNWTLRGRMVLRGTEGKQVRLALAKPVQLPEGEARRLEGEVRNLTVSHVTLAVVDEGGSEHLVVIQNRTVETVYII